MDDLYNNLENYHDEKIIDELKSENTDLKTKLEEYSSAMVRLQSDFDKLNAEYKKLEINYSSLLKTARAEIERKSDMIKSLNTEKDMLIIKALQSSGNNILTNRRPHFNDANKTNRRHAVDSASMLKPQKEPSLDYKNEGTNKIHRANSTWTQSEDTISSLENRSQFSDESRKINNNYRNKTKDNCTREIHGDDTMYSSRNGQNIFNRRKSISRIEPIYSSDDDFEALNVKNIKKSPLREDPGYYERHGNKSKCYSPSKDLYKNKTNRFIDHNKYRHSDRYESGKNYGRYSSEKFRDDNYKERVLKLPPSENYNRSKSRDRRPNYVREKYYDNERHSPHNHDYVKHKSRYDIYEPSSKRQKVEIYKTTEENIYDIEREEHNMKDNFKKRQDLIELSSCQSPDYDNNSILTQRVPKEIKHTAATPLEDPRVSGKKCALKINKDKPVSSTCVSDNVDLTPINVSTWDIPNKKNIIISEDTMKQLPKLHSEELVKEIYMNIDNPAVLKESIESGEIPSVQDSNSYSKNSDKMCEDVNGNTRLDQRESLIKLQIDSNKLHKSVTNINTYKIPNIEKADKDSNSIKHDNIETTTKKLTESNQVVERKLCEKVQTSHQDNEVAKINTYDDIKLKSSCKVISEKSKLPVNILADDLALSDEAIENRGLKNDKLSKRSKKIATKIKNKPTFMDVNKKCHDPQSFEHKTFYPAILKKALQKEVPCDDTKARKIKKIIEQSETKTAKDKNKAPQDNLKDKEDRHAISIHTRNKFSDLFGDSSSLITPDDLGISLPHVQLPLTDVFDNTQDAVDLKVEDINKEQPINDSNKASSFRTIEEISSSNQKGTSKISNDVKNIEIFEDSYKNSTNSNTCVNNLYENTKSETSSDISKVVKTVIISSGVQPKYLSENVSLQNTQTTEYIQNITNDEKENAKKVMINSVKALATSTPQKPAHEELSIISGPNDPNKDSQEINISSCASNSLNHNSQEIFKEVDVPDVRIFVRRRKKITKKS